MNSYHNHIPIPPHER